MSNIYVLYDNKDGGSLITILDKLEIDKDIEN